MNVIKKALRPIVNLLGRPKMMQFTDPPILIGGCGRSGTTLLLSILSAHHELFCHPKELGFFSSVSVLESGAIKTPRIHRIYQSLLFNKIPKTAKRWCEKSPSNIRHIDNITAFTGGDFKFIEIVRDGRDVILSRHPTSPDRYWVDPERWVRDVSIGLKYQDDPRVYTVRYVDLITDYENTIAGICEFLEIELTPELLSWHEHATATRNRAYFGKKVSRLTGDSIQKWKAEKHKERVQELLDYPGAIDLLKHHGYL